MHRGVLFLALAALACAAAGPAAKGGVWRGFYAYGPRANTFQPCGSKQVFWVQAENDLLRKLRVEHAYLTARPLERVYAELRGARAGEATEGPAARYDGLFRADGLVSMRAAAPGDCGESEASP